MAKGRAVARKVQISAIFLQKLTEFCKKGEKTTKMNLHNQTFSLMIYDSRLTIDYFFESFVPSW